MDFSDQPGQPKQIPAKLIAIVAVGVVIALVILIFIVRAVRKPTETQIPAASSPAKSVSESMTLDDCKLIAKEGKDDCIWGIARDRHDPSVCKKMEHAELITSCADDIYAQLAIHAGKSDMCDKISNETSKEGCRMTIEGPITRENCAKRADQAYCNMLNIAEVAIATKDRDHCNSLQGSLRSRCRDFVEVDDPDLDGIETGQETNVYHTDPHKADTDDDGYSDKQEINTGHDPLKK